MSTNHDRVFSAIRAGRTVILGGGSGNLFHLYDRNSTDGHFGHWTVVSGYDANTRTYNVLDPNARGKDLKPQKLTMTNLESFYNTSRTRERATLGGATLNR